MLACHSLSLLPGNGVCYGSASAKYRKLLTHFVDCSLYARGKLSQASFSCEFLKNEVMIMFVVGGQPENQANTSYKVTKHIERTFLISDCY